MRAMDLSDAQLLQVLRKHSLTVGPIVDSTRHLYRRKLCRTLDIDENQDIDPSVFFGDDEVPKEFQQFMRQPEVEGNNSSSPFIPFFGFATILILSLCWYYFM